ncbi:hypothetical protein CU097_011167 [Rhizopus azygosporus]|uniref:Uncharacterized protein n=1 Tax=Rhizopus azygosporus TaxID=86630 RepID=A0A367JLZ5_RHIAZ|nr:hypothetical protein CU097_011167 [Rhizopus azygosporus]
MKEPKEMCSDNSHLWGIEDRFLCDEDFELPSFPNRSVGHRSLPVDSEILTIIFNGFPCQYGRKDDGLEQLQADMLHNLSIYSTIRDSGILSRTAGVLSGRSYAVLEFKKFSIVSLTHKVHWQYSSVATVDPVQRDSEVLVYAHWCSMPPYCRYYYSPSHIVAGCPVKLRLTTYYHCNKTVHMSKGCPRKNSYVNSTAFNKKAHKSPVATQVFLHDNPTKKPVVRSISTQSSLAVHPTPINSKIDLLQSISDASAVSIVADISSSSASFPSSSRYLPCQTRSQTAAALISSEDVPGASSDIPSSSILEIVESESMELDNDDASHHQNAPSHVDPASAVDFCHNQSIELQQVFHTQFQAKDSIWSRHYGLVCFSPDLLFTNSIISDCGHIITATISHKHQLFDPFTVSDILRHPSDILSMSPARQILLGNFNYSYTTHPSTSRPQQAPFSWLQYNDQFFHDGITPVGSSSEATFHRDMTRSCIDYIFPAWSDRLLLSMHFRLTSSAPSRPQLGKSIWRAHPRLVSSKAFHIKLATKITRRIASFPTSTSAQDKWDVIKDTTIAVARKFTRCQFN